MHADYDAIEAVNWSTLVHLATSPRMLRWRAEHPRPDTRELMLGRAIHCAVLEPERWARDYQAIPNFGDLRTKAAKALRAAWIATLPEGVELLPADEHELAERCATAVREHPVAAEMLRGGRAEETIVWTDEETGLACKGRLDFVTPMWILDLKSTRHQTLSAIARDAASRMYHGQLAFYHFGAIAAGRLPIDAELPRVIAVQTVEPFDVVPARLPLEALDRGRGLCRSLLRDYAECQAADWWPGIAPALIDLDLPSWAASGNEPQGDDW